MKNINHTLRQLTLMRATSLLTEEQFNINSYGQFRLEDIEYYKKVSQLAILKGITATMVKHPYKNRNKIQYYWNLALDETTPIIVKSQPKVIPNKSNSSLSSLLPKKLYLPDKSTQEVSTYHYIPAKHKQIQDIKPKEQKEIEYREKSINEHKQFKNNKYK